MSALQVLLIDNSRSFLDAAAQLLGSYPQFAVIGCSTWDNGVFEMLTRLEPDVVLATLDPSKPVVTALGKRLKRLPKPPRLVVLADHGEPPYRDLAEASHAEAFVIKDQFVERVPRLRARIQAEACRNGRSTPTGTVEPAKATGDDSTAARPAEDRVKELEAQLAAERDRLMQAQRAGTVGHFTAGILHDLNNLITAIFTYADSVRGAAGSNQVLLDAAEQMVKVAKMGTHMNRALLSFIRQEPGPKARMELRECVKEVMRLTARLLPASIELVPSIEPNLPLWVRADETQMCQILLNLVVNARDAMPEGGMIRIRTFYRPHGSPDSLCLDGRWKHGEAVVEVEDTGCGMSEEVRARIFEPGFSTKPPGQGSGLGMAIVRRIVDDHGGGIRVESAPSMGTSVEFAIPCCGPGPREDGERTSVSIRQTGCGETVLLAEDVDELRGLVSGALHSAGYEVLETKDGIEAVKAFIRHEQSVRLLLLDVDMPRMGGLACLEHIRKLRPGIPCLLSSGWPDLAQGPAPFPETAVIAKPFQLSELVSHVERALGSLRASSSPMEYLLAS